MPTEQRFFNDKGFNAEMRVEARSDKPSLIIGYPAKFNRMSQNLGGFRENILPGAFKRTLAEGADVRGLLNHNPDLVLGRTTAGTMRLREDAIGLRMEIDAPDTQAARDLMTSIGRGDIDQGSFRFRTKTDNWRMQDGETVRDLVDVDLMDASVVTFPAYLDTNAAVRSISQAAGLDFTRVTDILIRVQHKLTVSAEDRELLAETVAAIEQARLSIPLDAQQAAHLETMRRRVDLAARE